MSTKTSGRTSAIARRVSIFAMKLIFLGTVFGILSMLALYLYTLPGLRRLPKARQRSLDGVTTIDDAVRALQHSGKTGWELVAAAQALVNAKMEYSRRSGWDTAPRAFQRGMGYCQQQATALLLILRRLGIAARPVRARRCNFPPAHMHEYDDSGGISGHMWLVVTIDGVEKDVCPGHPDNRPGKVHFDVLSRRTAYPPVMRLFGHIGSMILNMHRDNAALHALQSQTTQVAYCVRRRRRTRLVRTIALERMRISSGYWCRLVSLARARLAWA